jgi:NosR/NirI family nitrous oxide reductase transcriptional regulator
MNCGDLQFAVGDRREGWGRTVWSGFRRKSQIVSRKSRGWFGAFPPLLVFFSGILANAQQRFPPPDFESGHQIPATSMPPARAFLFQYLDVIVLASCLVFASWLVYRKRSRKGLIGLSLFSLVYFGFWRKGCMCSIGSLQNVSLALFDSGYAVPASVLGFFVLPLAVALFFGRTFCAGVCPHGALQDLVLLRPIKVPAWLEQGLSILPFIYLGAGVLFAATGSAFIICEYDPFVPVFRMSGRMLMVLSGVALLVLGTVVGRPYCRFLCPYGALLKLGAMVARWRVRVTPDYCTQCRLCEAACPFGAMREPQSVEADPVVLAKGRKHLAVLLVLLPFLIAGGGAVGAKFSATAARLHPTVALADRLVREKDAPSKAGVLSPDDLALERARQHPEELPDEAEIIRHKFAIGSLVFGAWIGAVVGLKLTSLALQRRRVDYEPERGDCFACARCFEFCPNELARHGIQAVAVSVPGGASADKLEPAVEQCAK